MAWSSDSLYFPQKIGFGRIIVAIMLIAKFFDFCAIGWTEVLPDDFFGDVSANIFSVVTWFFDLYFFFFWFEDFWEIGLFLRECVDWIEGEDEWSFSICGWTNELSENGVIRFLSGEPVGRLKYFLIGLFEIEVLISHVKIIVRSQHVTFSDS